jgi:hypothetical protein
MGWFFARTRVLAGSLAVTTGVFSCGSVGGTGSADGDAGSAPSADAPADAVLDAANADSQGDSQGAPPECPLDAQDHLLCSVAGAACTVSCAGCGVTPGGQGVFTRDPIRCTCVDGTWNCDAVDCFKGICSDYIDPTCTTPVPCEGGVPISPPPCIGGQPCAPGSYCKESAEPSTCVPVPGACVQAPTCACLASQGIACACTEEYGELIVTCP